MRKTVLGLVMVLAGAAAGCGSGDDGPADGPLDDATEVAATTTAAAQPDAAVSTTSSSTPETTTSAPPTTAPTGSTGSGLPPEPTDDELAELALLTLDYFPEGWTAQPAEPDSEDDRVYEDRFLECVGLGQDAASAHLDERDTDSPEFDSPDETLSVDQSVVLAADEATAIQIMAEIAAERGPACYEQGFADLFAETMADADQTDFPPGTELVSVTVDPLELDVESDLATAARAAIEIAVADDSVVIIFDNWTVRQGRALSQLQFQSIGGPFPQDGVAALVDAAVTLLARVG